MERFFVRQPDAELLDGERRRAVTMLCSLVPFAETLEVGSTAVEGVIGKNDIDLLVRVPRPRFVEARTLLDARLERHPEQISDDEFQGYRVRSPVDIAVQLTVAKGRYDNFEDFCDILRADPDLRQAYNDLKRAWNGKPMTEYRLAKQDFIITV